MDGIINKEAQKVEGQLGNWQLMYGNRPVLIITDEKMPNVVGSLFYDTKILENYVV